MKKIVIMALGIFALTNLTGCGLFATFKNKKETEIYSYQKAEDLKDNRVYVWKNSGTEDLRKYVDDDFKTDTFFLCPKGTINFEDEELSETGINPRSIWIDLEEDEKIPTLTKNDTLLYVSEDDIPKEIVFERFGDYGYSIGVSNLQDDGGNHYYLTYSDVDEKQYRYYVDTSSSAKDILQFEGLKRLFLDQVGDVKVNSESISKGGTVMGLKKGESYVCEFYTGTYYQDFKLIADVHTFGHMERFVSNDYMFLHSNCIAITIPDYFKTGYYYVNGIGLVRYLSEEDEGKYNGEPYDEKINWNDPIIIYDEHGFVVSDPSKKEVELELRQAESKKATVEVKENLRSNVYENSKEENLYENSDAGDANFKRQEEGE